MKLNVLVAFPYFTSETRAVLRDLPREQYRLIIDSGAYSAWNSGHPITLDDYCKFLDTLHDIAPDEIVQLDVFGQHDETWANFLKMRERGYDPMPVFTRGAPIELLDEMYTHKDYIMFGGIVTGGQNRNYVKWWLNRNKGRRAHWLGFCDLNFMKAYKPTSVDSTAWKSANLYGNLGVYEGYGKMGSVHRALVQSGKAANVVPRLRSVGVPEDVIWALRRDEAWIDNGKFVRGEDRCSAYFATALAHIARMVDVERAIGTRIYLAVAGVNHFPFLVKAWHHFREYTDGRTQGAGSERTQHVPRPLRSEPARIVRKARRAGDAR